MAAPEELSVDGKALAAAAADGIAAPDEWYCLKLLEATGLVVVPGSGFGQVDGTFHFRTTFLPPEDALEVVLPKLADFHNALMAEYAADEPLAAAEAAPAGAEEEASAVADGAPAVVEPVELSA